MIEICPVTILILLEYDNKQKNNLRIIRFKLSRLWQSILICISTQTNVKQNRLKRTKNEWRRIEYNGWEASNV